MSYDFEGNEEKPTTMEKVRAFFPMLYWRFVLWAALDAKSERINAWGRRRIYPTQKELR